MDANNAIWTKATLYCRCAVAALLASGLVVLGLASLGGASTGHNRQFGTTVAPGGTTPATGPRPSTASAAGTLAQPVVGAAATSSGKGYWLVAADGGIFSFGDASFLGSTGATPLNRPIVGMASTPSGKGYWLVASDGGVFSFGDARFFGSTGGIRLNQPIVGIASSPSGNGYWMVASDGGIFSFGDAAFYGSAGGVGLNRPIVGMTADRSGRGYWFVANDGGIFAFGDAAFYGSAGGAAIPAPIVGMATDASGHGYWLAGADGSVFTFGDAQPVGSAAGVLGQPVAALAAAPSGAGLWLGGQQGASVAMPSMTVFSLTGAAGASGGGSSSYSFLASNPDGSPVRWNPCQPIHYVTNLAMAPPSAAGDLAGALARVAAATGISFVNDGSTTEVPTVGRASQQARYGGGWAPVLIAWSTPGQSNLLPGGGVLGEGGATWTSAPGAPGVYVTGVVDIDTQASAILSPGFGGGLTTGDMLLHEIGHVLGLGHTADRAQVMYPDILTRSTAAYGPGDLSGFARLGTSSGCIGTPTP
jgi:hypothetical protein